VVHPASSLSDGTLRFLVLAALAIDPEAKGVICVEEPENGIHPERIPAMVHLLREIAVNPDYPIDTDNPLRQVIVNTHSPAVIKALADGELVYIDEKQVALDDALGSVALLRVPNGSWRASSHDATALPLTSGQLHPYQIVLPL